MANCSYLTVREEVIFDKGFYNYSENEILAYAKYEVPFFWFSIFCETDIYYSEADKLPSLISKISNATQRATLNRHIILKVLSNSYSDLYDKWIKYIGTLNPTHYIQVDLREYFWMIDPIDNQDKAVLDIRAGLEALNTGSIYDVHLLVDEFTSLKLPFFGGKENKDIDSHTKLTPRDFCGSSWPDGRDLFSI